MLSTRALLSSLVLISSLAACGGDDGGGSGGTVDAAPAIDAPPTPTGLTGLGQTCGQGLPACPANASNCVTLQGAPASFCTPTCLENGSGTTTAMAQFQSVTPAPNNATCTAAFTGSVGTAACGLILAYTPMDTPLVANKAYTGIQLACAIACGASNACPTGTSCTQGICLPQ